MPNIVAQLTITMDDAGGVQISGPIENKLLAYGLLEIARDSVTEYAAAHARRIQPVSAAERLALSAVK